MVPVRPCCAPEEKQRASIEVVPTLKPVVPFRIPHRDGHDCSSVEALVSETRIHAPTGNPWEKLELARSHNFHPGAGLKLDKPRAVVRPGADAEVAAARLHEPSDDGVARAVELVAVRKVGAPGDGEEGAPRGPPPLEELAGAYDADLQLRLKGEAQAVHEVLQAPLAGSWPAVDEGCPMHYASFGRR
eukprot:CAMPEP_0177612346 /NCGR_PEP_ID=MMETSP0419_2-20121207/21155_1 /TAXON_ID=582737 /ORGANISM="Tetraselmis sp., Strain GSL018" /LENGTH=187 /DNA_ID=CAMNT_0019108495 /DNA_START=371 /DNA_END=935 /DNA_ORIENTATION=+